MVNVTSVALAALAALLMLVALANLSRGNIMFAGLSFLSASLVIYFRETRAQ
jgi:membrane protein implicated in regulation of membrane protease activity